MSAICGIVNLVGERVPVDHLERMITASSHHGPDGPGRWISDSALFGHQMMHITQESISEVQPLHDRESGLTITADARLDNRNELFQILGIPQSERADYPDSRLLLKAYEKWREGCPKHLVGDFAFAIWDDRNKKLFCCRDHMGVRHFAYHRSGHQCVFATEAKTILALPDIERRLNKRKLALMRSLGHALVDNESSFYEGVQILPPATALIVENGIIRKQRYWEPDPDAKLPFKRDEDTLEALRDLMFRVVGDRLRSQWPVASLLSGGLDSSAVVSIAAKSLEKSGKRLTTLSAVAPDDNRSAIPDERYYIDQFRPWQNIDMHFVTDPHRGPFDDVEKAVRSYDSPNLTSRHYQYTAFTNAARNAGARVIMDGAMGELGPTCHGYGFYPELLVRLHWIRLFRELRLRRRLDRTSIRSEVLHGLIPLWVRTALRRNLPVDDWQKNSPLRSDFIAEYTKEFLKELTSAQEHVFDIRANQKYNQYKTILSVNAKSRSLNGFVGYNEVEFRYPFLDKRLLEFCLAAPTHLKVRNGYKRYLVRASLDKILPPEIQWRTTKLPFSPDYQLRYNAQRKWACSFLAEIGPRDPVREVVDVERLKTLAGRDMPNVRATTSADNAAQQIVPLGIYTIVFLRQFSEFRQ